MYRLDRKRTLVWVAVVVLLGYAFFNFYSESATETTAETTIMEQLAQRITALETQVAELEATVASLEDQAQAPEDAEPGDEAAAEPQATTAVVVPQYLNVRAEPSTDALRVGVLTKDTQVTVLDQQGEWSQVQFNDLSGWVASQYISVKDD